MAVSDLITTPGAVDANAYVSLAVADQYHEDRPSDAASTWTNASVDNKKRAILWATKLIDALYVWAGYPTTETQALLWPRQGMLKRSGRDYVDENTIPTELQQATAEYARQLLVGDLAGNNDVETQGITSITAGPVSLSFKDNVTAKPVPDAVIYLIPSYWGYPAGRMMPQVARA